MTKHTPLYMVHRELGADLTDFHGYLLPLQYTTISEEHMAVRTKAGIFDLSHMGQLEVSGTQALAFIQEIITNDAEGLPDGKALYTPICNENGGIVDDVLLYRFCDEKFLFVVNSANRQKVFGWLVENQEKDVRVTDLSDEFGMIAVQGPSSEEIVEKPMGHEAASLKHFHFCCHSGAGEDDAPDTIISRTGYTGEDGFEIYVPAARCESTWNKLMAAGRHAGLRPAGLGSRDTLRLEAGLLLYGNDIDDSTTPLEAGIDWTVKLQKKDFFGKSVLLDQKASGVYKRLVGLELVERGIPRAGYIIYSGSGSDAVGKVTSGTYSPFFRKGIALGYVHDVKKDEDDEKHPRPGDLLQVDIRGRKLGARVVTLPFYRGGTTKQTSS